MAKIARETKRQKEARLHEAATRKIRRLSGWNVFVADRMQGAAVLGRAEYSQKQKDLSKEWKRLPQEEQEAFHIEAARQQNLRDRLETMPLSTADAAPECINLENEVGKKACKHLSARRLLLNVTDFAQHSAWNLPTCLADSFSA